MSPPRPTLPIAFLYDIFTTLTAGLLFIMLTPGVITRIPYYASTYTAAFVHTTVFFVVFFIVHRFIYLILHTKMVHDMLKHTFLHAARPVETHFFVENTRREAFEKPKKFQMTNKTPAGNKRTKTPVPARRVARVASVATLNTPGKV